MNPENIYNEKLTSNILDLMKSQGINQLVICGILDLRPSGVNDLLSNKTKWKLSQIIMLAEYFGVRLDKIVFNDEDYILKFTKEHDLLLKNRIRKFLIENKNYKTLGELTAKEFFKELDESEQSYSAVAEPKTKYKSK